MLALFLGCLENGENEENPILWFINVITINRGGGGGVWGCARSIQLLYLMAYQLYPRYFVYIYLLAIHISGTVKPR